MQYYHFYRTTNDDTPRLNDAGWIITKVDKFDPNELERHTPYRGNFIHRFIIPEDIMGESRYRMANSHDNWKNAANNPLIPLSEVNVGEFKVAYEIKFDKDLDPMEFYIKQEYPKELDMTMEGTFQDKPAIPRPKTLELGQKLHEKIMEIEGPSDIPVL